jgi:hypothetical protein
VKIILKDISNGEFLCEKAKDVLPKVLESYENEQIISIIDPPGDELYLKLSKH